MMKLPFINRIFPSYRSRIVAVIIGGIIVGGGALFMYMLRAHTYLGDDPAACVNCHIMSPYYATWFHSSHARDATCNDCHVPHENIIKKWTFKGMDGMKHVAAFLAKSEPQVIQAHEASSQVIMNKLYPLPYATEYGVCKNRKDRLYDVYGGRRKGLLGLSSGCTSWW